MMGSDSGVNGGTRPGLGGSPSPPPREEMERLVLSDAAAFHPLAPTPHPFEEPVPEDDVDDGAFSSAHPLLETTDASSFLDPPSYADAVFSPSGGSPDNRPPSTHPGSRAARGAIYTQITVGSPQKEQDPAGSLVPGSGTYVTYLVTSRSASGEEPPSAVRRRFRDVVALADRLADSYRGLFIPPRPDKSVVESQVMHKQEFVEQRRAAIEKYLRRLAAHPVIGRSDDLRAFLRSQNLPSSADLASSMLDGVVRSPRQLLGDAGSPREAVQPAKGGRDLFRMFRELKQAVVNDWGGVKPTVVEEDKEFMEKKQKFQELEQQLTTTSQQAEALVKAQQDMGETMGELGLALIKLTKFEAEEAVHDAQRIRAADTRLVGTSVVKASRFYRESNAHSVKYLDTLHDYLGLMLSVHSAFSDRSSALLTVQTLSSDLSSLQAKAEKLEAASSKTFGADLSKTHKLEELKDSIRSTEDAKNAALKEYERIKENNRSEFERIDRERKEDLLGMIKGFVVNQVGYAEKIANVWENVVEETKKYKEATD